MMRRSLASYFWSLSLAMVGMGLLLATFNTALAGGLSQGYQTADRELAVGMAVALTEDSTAENTAVERASLENVSKVIGLAVGAAQNSVVISTDKQQVYVQTSGNAIGYVTDVNGHVKKGDLLTISPLKGVLMRSEGSGTDIIGVALDDLATATAETYTIQTGAEGTKQALVGKIGVNLDHKTVVQKGGTKATTTLVALGHSVTGRDTSELRILIALVVFLLILIAEGGIIYGAIASAITAVGRNPLASTLIRGELVRVLFVALFVLGFGAAIIYILLWT